MKVDVQYIDFLKLHTYSPRNSVTIKSKIPYSSWNNLETLQQLSAHVITIEDKQRQTFLQQGFQTCSVLTLNVVFDIMSNLCKTVSFCPIVCNRLGELQPLGDVTNSSIHAWPNGYRTNVLTMLIIVGLFCV